MIEPHIMVAFENISKKFNDRLIINDFNLNVRPGDKVLIYGKSGIGKLVYCDSTSSSLPIYQYPYYLHTTSYPSISLRRYSFSSARRSR